MKYAVRLLFAVVAGMALALLLVVGVEFLSSAVHPLPPNFDGDIGAHVRRYPQWVLAAAALAWGATITAATWVATRIGRRPAGICVALLLACALTFNLTHLPYVLWFKIVMFCAFPVACLLGLKYGNPHPKPASPEPVS